MTIKGAKTTERMLRDVVLKNNLRCISISFMSALPSLHFICYVHWEGNCESGSWDTIEGAIERALKSMEEHIGKE